MDPDDTVELGIELLARLEHAEIQLADLMDRIELVTAEPHLQERIIQEATARGVIERIGTTIRPASGAFLRYQAEVTRKEGDFACRRCGADLSTGYFMQLETGELGPFGSTCIRLVTGRD